jgi:hydroxymethylbilane synthase
MICGTRGSQLALAQVELVLGELACAHPEVLVTRRLVRTSGDVFSKKPVSELVSTGVFVRELDELLLKCEVDFAVHSLKDIPTKLRKGVEVAAVLKRGNPRDFLVSPLPLSRLPRGATLGTSSLRRRAQLLNARPDIRVVPLRGNVPTRLRKVHCGGLDGAIMAKAGLDRLGLEPNGYTLPLRRFVPSPAQGAIAVVAREGSPEASMLRSLDHPITRVEAEGEREVMRLLGGGCTAPVGVHAHSGDKWIDVIAMVLSLDGSECVEHTARIPVLEPENGFARFAEQLAQKGGKELVAKAAKASTHW